MAISEASGYLESVERREDAVVVSLLTKSLLHRERRDSFRAVWGWVNILKIGDANTCVYSSHMSHQSRV